MGARRSPKPASKRATKQVAVAKATAPDASARKPDRPFTQIQDAGAKALELMAEHGDPIIAAKRLPTDAATQLEADVKLLDTLRSEKEKKATQSQASTADRNADLLAGHSLMTAIRFAVTKTPGAKPATRKFYGVGLKTSPTSVTGVKHGIGLILDRAAAEPVEALAHGITVVDTDRLTGYLSAIDAKAGAQRRRKMGAPAVTRMRNQAANRVIASVDMIGARGSLHYNSNPAVAEVFQSLIGHGKSKGGRAPKVVDPSTSGTATKSDASSANTPPAPATGNKPGSGTPQS